MILRKYIDIPSKEIREKVKAALEGKKLTYDRNSTPECNYIDEKDFHLIKHLLNVNKENGKQTYTGDPRVEFKAFIEGHGYPVNGYPEMDGEKHLLTLNKKVKAQYCGYTDGKPNGWLRDFVSGEYLQCKFSGKIEGDFKISKAEMAQKSYDKFVDKAKTHREIGKKAHWLFENKGTKKETTAYLDKKKVKKFTTRITEDNSVMVPLKNFEGFFTNLQFIAADGSKKFLGEGKLDGTFFQMGFIAPKSTIILCEGFATGATMYENLKHPTICAMTSNNLVSIAAIIKKKYPDNKVFIAADNDRFQKKAKVNINAGVVKAEQAQELIGEKAKIGVPDFDDKLYAEEQHDLIDWNDFILEYGKESFLKDLEGQGIKPKRERPKKVKQEGSVQ
jgi:phage/plasmid primase-like uncharacterized protein